MAYISKTGITNTSTIDAEHITRIIDALDGTTTTEVSASGQFSGSHSGSFLGDGSGLTGVTAEWDGSHNGSANITGSLTVTGEVIAGNRLVGEVLRSGANLSLEATHITASATTFLATGTISGSNVSGTTSGTNTGDQDLSPYVLNSVTSSMSVATASVGLTASYVHGDNVDEAVALATLATNATNVAITEETSNASFNIHFGSATSGNDGVNISPQITYNPSTRVLLLRNISASTDAHVASLYSTTVTYNNAETKAAAGENQAAATALSATTTLSYVTSADVATGVKLPTIATCVAANGEGFQKIITNTSDTGCRVYPGSGDAIGGTSDNVHQVLAGHSSMVLFCSGSVRWVGHKTTNISGE